MQRKHILWLLLVLILSVGFFIYKQISYITKGKWEPAGFKIEDIGPSMVSFYIYFKLNNPGLLSLTISQQDYNIYLNNSYVTRVVNKGDTVIKAQGVSSIPFLIQFRVGDVVKAGLDNFSALLSKEKRSKLKVRIEGKLTLTLGYLTIKKLKFDVESTIAELSEGDKTEIKT